MSRMTLLAASFVALFCCEAAAAQEPGAQGDEGMIAFNNHCRNCHSFKADDNRIGPSLHGIVGKPAGQVKGYGKYSGALDGLTWDEATLDKWIADPGSVIPGNGMSPPYSGIDDPAIRKRIIAFLKAISPKTNGTP